MKEAQGTSAAGILLNVTVPLVLCCPQQSQAQTGWVLSIISFREDLKAREFLESGIGQHFWSMGRLDV